MRISFYQHFSESITMRTKNITKPHYDEATLQHSAQQLGNAEFDTQFIVDSRAGISFTDSTGAVPNIYLGTVNHSNKYDIEIDGVPTTWSEWMPVTGLTNQYGYSGAVLHSSEVMSEGIIRRLAEITSAAGTPQVFVMTVVTEDVSLLSAAASADAEAIGWCILQHVGSI